MFNEEAYNRIRGQHDERLDRIEEHRREIAERRRFLTTLDNNGHLSSKKPLIELDEQEKHLNKDRDYHYAQIDMIEIIRALTTGATE